MATISATRTRSDRLRARALVVLGAVLAAAAVWVIAVPIAGLDVTVPETPSSTNRIDLALAPVVVASLLASLAGWALLAVLERFVPRKAALVWTVIAVLFTLVSLPFGAGFTGTERAVLAALHLAVAAVAIPFLPRAGRSSVS